MTSIADLLFPTSHDSANVDRLAIALGDAELPLQHLLVGPFLAPMVEVAGIVHRLVNVPAVNVALKGWEKHKKVAEAMENSKKVPDDPWRVRLAQHSIKNKQSPSVEATAGGVTKTVLELDLVVELEIASVDLIVQNGRIVDAETNGAVAKAKLSASKVTLAEGDFKPADLRRKEPPPSEDPVSVPPPPLGGTETPAPPPPLPTTAA